MFLRFLMTGANHRWTTLIFLVLATCFFGFGLTELRVDTSFDSLIPDTHPDKKIYDQIVKEFGSDNRSIVYIKDINLWSNEKLIALEKLHLSIEKLGFVKQVDDLFTLRSIRGTEKKMDTGLILSGIPLDQKEIDQAKADALYNPLVRNNFISSDGIVTAILVTLHPGTNSSHSYEQINFELEKIIMDFKPEFQSIFQVGSPRIHTELKDILFDDLKLLSPLSAFALVVAILFFLRSGFAAFVPLVTSFLSIFWTFGIMGWVDIPINLLSAMLPSLIVVIGSTEDTHMISAYFQGLSQKKTADRMFAIRFMMKHLGVPLILTVFTTALGFAGNTLNSMSIIQNFAIASTIAIFVNGLITWLFVPMALAHFGPVRTKIFRKDESVKGIPGLFVRMFGFTAGRFSRLILIGTAVLCLFFIYQCSKLVVTNDPLSYFQKDQPLIADTHKIHQDLSGIKVFYISLASNQEKAFLTPKNIQKLSAIQNFLKKQEIFDTSLSLADYLCLVNQEFHQGDTDQYRVPDQRNLVAQYLLFFNRRDLENYVSHDYKRACIVVRHNVSDSSVLNAHVKELKQVVAQISGPEMTGHVVGENLMINAAAEDLMMAQVKSLTILLAVIFVITSVMFTSIKGGIISLIPSLIPIVLMFGIMGLLDIPLNPGTAMVALIAIGIAVDGTLHLFSRYNELCRRTSDYDSAVLKTVAEEATPMVTTSLSLALGFGILLLSNFTIIAQFGALSAATMIFALFANLLITPLIMSRVRLVGLYQILALKMHKDVLAKSPLFAGLTNYQMRKAILISELNEFKQGQLVVKKGTIGRSMYLILSGKVDILRKKGEDEQSVAVLTPGQVFGEIGYIKEIERTADVRAITPVEVLRFDYLKLEKDLKFFPFIVAKLNFNISCILGERLAEAYDSNDKKRS